MKKNIRAVMMIVAVALIAGVNVFNSQTAIAMSDIALANIEALADGESTDSDCFIYCEPDYRYSCYISWGAGIQGVSCPEMRKR